MKNTLLFLFILVSTNVFTQKIQQYGNVKEINSNNKHISGVQVDFIDAVPTTSDNEGHFILHFSDKKYGQSIYLKEGFKKDFEVVNIKELRPSILNQTNELTILLCPAGYIDKKKAEYYNVSVKILNMEYTKQLTILEQRLDRESANEGALYNQMKELREKYEITQDNAEELAEKFARVNYDDVSKSYKEALNQYQEGNLDEAITILNDTIIDIPKFQKEENKIKQQELAINNREQKYLQQRILLIDNIKLKADLHLLRLEPEVSDSLYNLVCRLDTGNFNNLYQYVSFLYRYNYLNKAQLWIDKTMKIANNDLQKAFLYTSLGALFLQKKEFSKSITFLNKSEEIDHIHFLNEDNINTSDPFIFNREALYANFSRAYTESGDYEQAISYSIKAIELYQKNTNLFKKQLIDESVQISNLFYRKEDFKDGVNWAELAIILIDKINDDTDPSLQFSKASALNILGQCYKKELQYNKAEEKLQEALIIKEKLAHTYPDIYNFTLSETLISLGSLYLEQMNYSEALAHYNKAYTIRKNLFTTLRLVNNDLLSQVQYNLGAIYLHLQNNEKAIQLFEEVLIQYKDLYELNSEIYTYNIIAVHNNLGLLYYNAGDYTKAHSNITQAIKYSLSDINSDTKLMLIKESYRSHFYLGLVSLDTYQFDICINNLKKAGEKAEDCYNYTQNIEYKKRAKETKRLAKLFSIKLVQNELIKFKEYKQNSGISFSSDFAFEMLDLYSKIEDNKSKIEKEKVRIKTAQYCGDLSWYYILDRKYDFAEKFARKGLSLDENAEWINKNLSLALLLQDKFEAAELIYLEYKEKKYPKKTSLLYKDVFMQDFNTLGTRLITNDEIDRMKKRMNE